MIELYSANFKCDAYYLQSQKSGEAPAPLAQVVINHPGAYSGPLLSSEHLAAITGVIVVYIAITCRGKLLS